jgi:hypothetical protein
MENDKVCPECEIELDAESGVCEKCGWDGMNEGDYHSGPYGYSPGTAYPNTQYGSGFDEEAEWYR